MKHPDIFTPARWSHDIFRLRKIEKIEMPVGNSVGSDYWKQGLRCKIVLWNDRWRFMSCCEYQQVTYSGEFKLKRQDSFWSLA